ncbi:ubiquinone/menaquinone biosynthesis methyltransferase [Holospora curviuscula]|uniref:Ubiquinone/menaquinone biosynthesis C-methyltransferase UbiE n=1 Tax=Holospora curviuscula TaxID=1082868 RepID=A0A2S5R8M6_9PROT|nr:ubiquinone/menaquinone biosynthesis methyltransferase [Holospora curviuscula]PPE03691.1 Ubiquinone/menaquinone biosynthesis C-methyltransferase UbiE [Holospora curviuscula]
MHSTSSLFDRIAPVYDQMNKIMSLGQDDYWRKTLVSHIPWSKYSNFSIIDMACGTGAMTEAVLEQTEMHTRSCNFWMIDPSKEMLNRAKQRNYNRTSFAEINFVQAYAECVRLPSEIAQVYVCAFGLRNMKSRTLALKEAFRLLTPEGSLLILEFSFEVLPSLAWAYRYYLLHGIPFLGRWLAGDAEAYEYLSNSIYEFPPPSVILDECSQAGFQNSQCIPLCSGIVQLYSAQRPKNFGQIEATCY